MATKRARIGNPPPLQFGEHLRRRLAPIIALIKASAMRVTTVKEAESLGARLRAEWSDSRIRGEVEKIARSVEKVGSQAWVSSRLTSDSIRFDVRRKPYDGDELLKGWIRQAVGLISSVRDEVAEGMARDILAAARKGIASATLAQKWIERGIPVLHGTLEGRMRVIAQHQIQILHSRVQSERARSVGVTDFIWRTQGDDRVRPRHEDLEGSRWSYDNPPKDQGLPGEPINCRCWAESVIPAEIVQRLAIFAPVIEV